MNEDNLKEQNSDEDRLAYLREQKRLVEEARQAIEQFRQICSLQKEVTVLENEKWSRIDKSVESVQEDVDWYSKEYIIPMQEKQKELHNLETSLISVPEKQGIFGKLGKFFEKFIPGITKEGRQKRRIEGRKGELEEEIESYKILIEKRPFKVFGTDKEIKGKLLERMDVTQLDKYSTMRNDPQNYAKRNNSVKSIADSIRRDDMANLLNSYPALREKANYLTGELVNNGIDAFIRSVNQIARESAQRRDELTPKIDIEKDGDKDILDRINQEIQALEAKLGKEELADSDKQKKQDDLEKE